MSIQVYVSSCPAVSSVKLPWVSLDYLLFSGLIRGKFYLEQPVLRLSVSFEPVLLANEGPGISSYKLNMAKLWLPNPVIPPTCLCRSCWKPTMDPFMAVVFWHCACGESCTRYFEPYLSPISCSCFRVSFGLLLLDSIQYPRLWHRILNDLYWIWEESLPPQKLVVPQNRLRLLCFGFQRSNILSLPQSGHDWRMQCVCFVVIQWACWKFSLCVRKR